MVVVVVGPPGWLLTVEGNRWRAMDGLVDVIQGDQTIDDYFDTLVDDY